MRWLSTWPARDRVQIVENCQALNRWAMKTEEARRNEEQQQQELQEEQEKEYWG